MIKVASIILENPKGELLLYLRDNKPTIPFPHYWDLFGGHVELGETPEQALVRELQEELGIELNAYTFFRKYICLDGDVRANEKYIYCGRIAKKKSELTLREGERLSFFHPSEIPDLKMANVVKNIVMDYLEFKKNPNVERVEKLYLMAAGLNRRFPEGNNPFEMVTRLAEETGELAEQVNHFERRGVKIKKLGEPNKDHLAKEVMDVLRAALQVAQYYGIEKELSDTIDKSFQKMKKDGYI